MAQTYKGACFCGAVTFEVVGEAPMQGYCHCDDCRHWFGSPLTAYALWPSSAVKITGGAEHVVAYSKSGQAERQHCAKCGGAVMTVIPAAGMSDVYPALLAGFAFQPQSHVHYGLRVLDLKDGLPKFRDMPAEAGGSGEMVGE
jgi:hypothetical protein